MFRFRADDEVCCVVAAKLLWLIVILFLGLSRYFLPKLLFCNSLANSYSFYDILAKSPT